MNNCLFVRPNNNKDFLFYNFKKSGCNVEVPYKGNKLFFRIIREIWFRYHLPFPELWYNKKIIKNKYDTIFVFDPLMKVHFLEWLRKNQSDCRLIFNYSNPTSKAIKPTEYASIDCEKWSWNEVDCVKYNMDYNTGVYFDYLRVDKKKVIWDAVFIGRDKGRKKELDELNQQFQDQGLSLFLYITADRKYKRFLKPYYKKLIPYDKIRDYISQSRAIVDLVQEGQTGTTMRTMESIFNEIKLITNNPNIKNHDFYRKENIYILGQEDRSIKEFLDTPYAKIDENLINYYTFPKWLERFNKGR